MLKNHFLKILFCGMFFSLSFVHASSFYEKVSEEIDELQKKIISFVKNQKEESEKKAVLAITGKGYLPISQEKALQIASRNVKGYPVKSNIHGKHPVFAGERCHFKSALELEGLDPAREFAVYSFYKLLTGQGAPASALLVLNNVETVNDEGRKKNRYVVQASSTVPGEDFHNFFRNHKEDTLNFLSEESVSELILASFLTNPSDAKADNFIVSDSMSSRRKRNLVSIDNDLNFFSPYSLENTSLKLNIKNILYFEPFIKSNISSDVRLTISRNNGDLFILYWFSALWEQDKNYHRLMEEGFISEIELREQEFPLAIYMDILKEIPNNLRRIQFWLKRDVSLKTLFRVLHPLVHDYYKKLFEEKGSARKALNMLYDYPASFDKYLDLSEKLEDDRTLSQAIEEEKIHLNESVFKKPAENSLQEFAQEYFLPKFHLLYSMLKDKSSLASFKLLLHLHYGDHFPVDEFSEFIFLQGSPIIERGLQQGGFLKSIHFLLNTHGSKKLQGKCFEELVPVLKLILHSYDMPDSTTYELGTLFDPPFDKLYVPKTDFEEIENVFRGENQSKNYFWMLNYSLSSYFSVPLYEEVINSLKGSVFNFAPLPNIIISKKDELSLKPALIICKPFREFSTLEAVLKQDKNAFERMDLNNLINIIFHNAVTISLNHTVNHFLVEKIYTSKDHLTYFLHPLNNEIIRLTGHLYNSKEESICSYLSRIKIEIHRGRLSKFNPENLKNEDWVIKWLQKIQYLEANYRELFSYNNDNDPKIPNLFTWMKNIQNNLIFLTEFLQNYNPEEEGELTLETLMNISTLDMSWENKKKSFEAYLKTPVSSIKFSEEIEKQIGSFQKISREVDPWIGLTKENIVNNFDKLFEFPQAVRLRVLRSPDSAVFNALTQQLQKGFFEKLGKAKDRIVVLKNLDFWKDYAFIPESVPDKALDYLIQLELIECNNLHWYLFNSLSKASYLEKLRIEKGSFYPGHFQSSVDLKGIFERLKYLQIDNVEKIYSLDLETPNLKTLILNTTTNFNKLSFFEYLPTLINARVTSKTSAFLNVSVREKSGQEPTFKYSCQESFLDFYNKKFTKYIRRKSDLKDEDLIPFNKKDSFKIEIKELLQDKSYIPLEKHLEKNLQQISSLNLSYSFISTKEVDILIKFLRGSSSPIRALILKDNLIKAPSASLLLDYFFKSQQNGRELDLSNNLIHISSTQEDLDTFLKEFIKYNNQENQEGFLWLRGNPLSSSQLKYLDKVQTKKAINVFIEREENRFLRKIDFTLKVKNYLEESFKEDAIPNICNLSKSALRTADMIALSAFFGHKKNIHQLMSLNIGGNALNKNTLPSLALILKNQTNLTSLSLYETSFHGERAKEVIENLLSLSHLKKLNLASTYMSHGYLEQFTSVLKNHPSLAFLNLANNNFNDTQADLLSDLLKNHSRLDEIDLRWNSFSDQGAISILNGLKENACLSILRLENNSVTASIIQDLSQKLSKNIIQHARNKKDIHQEVGKLSYYKVPQTIQEEITSILRNEGSLYLEGMTISPFMQNVILQALEESKIYVVSLKNCQLTQKNFDSFVEGLKPRTPLKSLDLSKNQISNLEPLLKLIQKRIPLTHLNLEENLVSGVEVKNFFQLLKGDFFKIKELNLSFNPVSFEDVEASMELLKKKTTPFSVQILNRKKEEEIIYFGNISKITFYLNKLSKNVPHKMLTAQQIKNLTEYNKVNHAYFECLPVSLQYAIVDDLDTLEYVRKFGSLSKYFKSVLNDYLDIKYPFFNKIQITEYFHRLNKLSSEDKWLVKHENNILYNKEYYKDDILDKVKKSKDYFKYIVQKKETLGNQFKEAVLKEALFKTRNALKDKFFSSSMYRSFIQLTKAKLFFYSSKLFPLEEKILLKKSEINLHKLMQQENAQSYTYGEAHFFKWKYLSEEDIQRREGLLKEAVHYNNPKAEFVLGEFYEEGKEGHLKDILLALDYYKKSAEQEFLKAQYKLGFLFLEGDKSIRNQDLAIYWLTEAAKKNHAMAQEKLGLFYYETQAWELAFHWLGCAAANNQKEALYRVGYMYENGYGTPKNLQEAYFWYQKSSQRLPVKEGLIGLPSFQVQSTDLSSDALESTPVRHARCHNELALKYGFHDRLLYINPITESEKKPKKIGFAQKAHELRIKAQNAAEDANSNKSVTLGVQALQEKDLDGQLKSETKENPLEYIVSWFKNL